MSNQNPTGYATATLAATTPNTSYTIYSTNLLQGFYDPDGDALYVSGLSSDYGEITNLGNGQWQFIPNQDFNGDVTLTYFVTDKKGGDIQSSLSFNVLADKNAPTGSVTISGTPSQNQTLTVTNDLTDTNGIGIINYQWQSNGYIVSNQSYYTLTQSDVGKTISVTASYTDGNGKLESVSSSSVTVTNVNDLPTGTVTISGTVAQGQTLTASNNLTDLDGIGTITYQWLRDGNIISGANYSSYALTTSDIGKAISVKASYTDLFKTAESVTSDPTSQISAGQTAPTGNVTISGIAQQNQTLIANTSTVADVNGLGIFSYQWLSNGTTISNQTSQNYALTQSDVGKAISVKVSYTDGLGKLETLTSTATNLISDVNDKPIGTVSISGITTQGQILTASNNLTDADGIGTINYQWLRNGALIDGATQATYKLNATDIDKAISVKASYTDKLNTFESVTSQQTTISAATNSLPTGSVSISGTPQQNQTLTVKQNLADADGIGDLSYQWLRDGSIIRGATQNSYIPTQIDVAKSISISVSYTDGLGKKESMTSGSISVSNANDTPTGSVSISGNVLQGQTLTAFNNLADADGLGVISYQWLNNNNEISGANQSTYVLTKKLSA